MCGRVSDDAELQQQQQQRRGLDTAQVDRHVKLLLHS